MKIYEKLGLDELSISEIERVKKKYPMKVNPYYLNLITKKGDPIWKQCIPSMEELEDKSELEDPLHEEQYTPVPNLVHRYPDRVLFLVSTKCAMYCRFCTRKRKVGKWEITGEDIWRALHYISEHKEIRDVILSGGDPLMLSDHELENILSKLREIEHVEVIRIGTRIPCTLPMRITKRLCNMLKKYHPLFMNLHFEHPREITEESRRACSMLADAGIPLGNQSVLLKGINDDPDVLKELFQKLLKMRVKPYYLYQADQVKGTEHFRTDIETGLNIIKTLHGHTSGLCVPHYVIDTVGGGKIPQLPEYAMKKSKGQIFLRNFEGKDVVYTNPRSPETIGVVYNLKKDPENGKPHDHYAEFDDIGVPMAIKCALEKNGHNVELIEADSRIYHRLANANLNFVFNIAEGMHGTARESQVPAILDMLKIPYTGSGVLALAITLDKKRTNEILAYNGVPVPDCQLFETSSDKCSLSFPLIVKPVREGSSKGITNKSVVFDEDELKEQVELITKTYGQPAVAEQYLDGREFTVSIIGNNPPQVLPIVEITFDHLPEHLHKFDSYEVKWIWDSPDNPDSVICPAKISPELQKRISDVALRAFKVLGIRDMCRIDMRLDSSGIPRVIDVNALPGLMPDPRENSRFPKACYAAGMDYNDIINKILDEAMSRNNFLLSKVVQ